jgi:spore coat polysaccharide biosynthesis predicted glycosyltransferase SpsG
MSPYGKWLEENMAPFKLLMLNENVALGAPGHSSWERCAMGIPTLQITWTESQRLVGKACVEAGAAIDVWNVLEEGPIDYDELKLRIESIVSSDVFDAMADNARKLCDGNGVERTIKLMEEMVCK